MSAVFLSFAGFASLLLADLARLSGSAEARLPPAALGCALGGALGAAGYAAVTAALVLQVARWGPAGEGSPLRWAGLAAASPFLLLLVYSVLVEIPLRTGLEKRAGGRLYTAGSYGLCRHPGLLWFLLAHAALNGVYRSGPFLLISLAMAAGDLALVLVQDTVLFPRLFDGYDAYRRAVPFLLPQPRRP